MRIPLRALSVPLGVLVLMGILLLRRPRVDPPVPRSQPAPLAKEAVPTPESPAPRPNPTPPPKPGNGPSLLAELAQAIHNGDDPATRAILEKLRELLFPPIPEKENAAVLLGEAFSLIKPLVPRGPERTAYDALLAGKELSPEQLGPLRTWFATNSEPIDRATRLLREAADRPRCRFDPGPAKPDDGFVVVTTPFTGMQYASNLLCVQAALFQADGRREESAENLRAALALARATRSEPTMITQMVGCSLNTLAWDTIQRLGAVDLPNLSESIAALDPVDFRRSGERAMMGEVYGVISTYLKWKSDPSTALDDETRRWILAPETAPDLAVYVQSLSEATALGLKGTGEAQAELNALVLKYGSSTLGFATAAQGTIPLLPQLAGQLATSEAKASLLKVALELERYRARQGVYPAALDALQATLPTDPFTGQPFAYRREATGFVLEEPGKVGKAERLSWKSRP